LQYNEFHKANVLIINKEINILEIKIYICNDEEK